MPVWFPSLLPMLLLIKVTLLRQWFCGGSANQRFAEDIVENGVIQTEQVTVLSV